MLYEIYTAIKSHLTTADTGNVIKGIEWYNVQYDSTIATTPRLFIEFPDALEFDLLSKDAKRSPLKIRLHIVSQAITGQDGQINDQIVADHEVIATWVMNTLNKFKADGISTLQFSGWQHWHRHKNWLVTWVEFKSKITI